MICFGSSNERSIFFSLCEKLIISLFSLEGRKTLVFDLDETLIHCSEQLDIPHDVVIPIEFPNGVTIEVENWQYEIR